MAQQILSDEELAFLFNLLNSDDVKVSGRLSRNLEIIKAKIVKHLQPAEENDGDSADTAE